MFNRVVQTVWANNRDLYRTDKKKLEAFVHLFDPRYVCSFFVDDDPLWLPFVRKGARYWRTPGPLCFVSGRAGCDLTVLFSQGRDPQNQWVQCDQREKHSDPHTEPEGGL